MVDEFDVGADGDEGRAKVVCDGGGFIAEGIDFAGELAAVGVGAIEQVSGEQEDEQGHGDGGGEALDVPAGEDGGEAGEDAEHGGGGEHGRAVLEPREAVQWQSRQACSVVERQARQARRCVRVEGGSQHQILRGLMSIGITVTGELMGANQ